jgi:hypothetical protein
MDKKLDELITKFSNAAFCCGESDGAMAEYDKLKVEYNETKENLVKYIEEITVTKGGDVFEDLEVKKHER